MEAIAEKSTSLADLDPSELHKQLLLDFVTQGPRDDDDLHFYITEFLGIDVPRESVCEDCCAPFSFVADLFFERSRNALVLANRTGGKTQNFALLNHCEMVFKPGVTIVNVGAILKQADKCYRYVQETFGQKGAKHIDRDDAIHFASLVDRSIQSSTILLDRECGDRDGVSELEIVTMTLSGVNSPHPHKLNADEIDLASWAVLQEALSMAKSKDGIEASTRLTSTRKFVSGPMQRMLDEAGRRNFKVYKWCVWECAEPCTERECDDCKKIFSYDNDGVAHTFWSLCRGKLRKKTHGGFIKIDDVVDKFLNLDFEKFESQWLNRRPSQGSLWYPQFSRTRHVIKPFSIPASWPRFRAIDFGFTNPFVCVWAALSPEDDLVFYREHYLVRRTTAAHRKKINKLSGDEHYEFTVADPSGRAQRADLAVVRDDGVSPIKTRSAVNMFEYGIDAVTERLAMREVAPNRVRPRLIFFDTCENCIVEHEKYRKLPTADGKAEHERPLKRDDHTCDSVRYLCASLKLRNDRRKLREERTQRNQSHRGHGRRYR